MLELDKDIIEFVGKNWLAMYLSVRAVKLLSNITPWKWDDQVSVALSEMLDAVKGRITNGKNAKAKEGVK